MMAQGVEAFGTCPSRWPASSLVRGDGRMTLLRFAPVKHSESRNDFSVEDGAADVRSEPPLILAHN